MAREVAGTAGDEGREEEGWGAAGQAGAEATEETMEAERVSALQISTETAPLRTRARGPTVDPVQRGERKSGVQSDGTKNKLVKPDQTGRQKLKSRFGDPYGQPATFVSGQREYGLHACPGAP